MRVALYARVSTHLQWTLNQVPQLEAEANKRGWDWELFEEVESSRNTRPVKEDVLKRLRSGEFDGLVILKLDRWCRSVAEGALEVKELVESRGVQVVSLKDGLDLTRDERGNIPTMQKMMLHGLLMFAELERDLISDRTHDGLARAKRQGKKLGRPKGSKDKKPRRKSGYYLRHTGKKGGSAK